MITVVATLTQSRGTIVMIERNDGAVERTHHEVTEASYQRLYSLMIKNNFDFAPATGGPGVVAYGKELEDMST